MKTWKYPIKKLVLYSGIIAGIGMVLTIQSNSHLLEGFTLSEPVFGMLIFSYLWLLIFSMSWSFQVVTEVLCRKLNIQLEQISIRMYRVVPEKKWHLGVILIPVWVLTLICSIGITSVIFASVVILFKRICAG